MKKIYALLFMVSITASQPCLAVATVEGATITAIRTGWYADQVAVVIDKPIPNPSNCPTADGFVLNSSTPGFKTHYAAILTAMALERKVTIVVGDGCVADRPAFWGIYM
jgi:hypothetical protein